MKALRATGRAQVPAPPVEPRVLAHRIGAALVVLDRALRVVRDSDGRDALLDVRLTLTGGGEDA